jgi:hypothetical protein
MANHRCYVCNRVDKESRLVRATFTKDQDTKWGHPLCFRDCNTDLLAMSEPWRWVVGLPNDKISGPANQPAVSEKTNDAGSAASTC